MNTLSRLRRSFLVALLILLGFVLHAGVNAHAGIKAAAAPVVVYGTYLGGMQEDDAASMAVAGTGEIFVLGETYSEDFLGQATPLSGYSDLFVAKFNAAGTQLLYLTVIGSDDADYAHVLRVDGQGNAYVTASVYFGTFPMKNALWTEQAESTNGVLFKLDGQGNLVYSTYLPLDIFEARQNLAVDAAGNAYVTGTYLDVTEGEVALGDQIALLKISPDGAELLLDKQIGGLNHDDGRAITLDSHGAIYLAGITRSASTDPGSTDFPTTANAHQPQCGDITFEGAEYCVQDGVVVVLDAAGTITYASYHGGSRDEDPHAVAADGEGTVLVTGETSSTRFPLKNALVSSCPEDTSLDMCFATYGFASAIHIQPGESSVLYSTYLGSTERSSWTSPTAAALDGDGNGYIAGFSNGMHMPVQDALQAELAEGFCGTGAAAVRYCYDGFVLKLSPTGELAMGSYLGGHGDDYPWDIVLQDDGALFVTGATRSADFPLGADGYQPVARPNKEGFFVQIDVGGDNPPPPDGNPLWLPMIGC